MPTPGPYDDAIAALGVQINALTQDLKALRDGESVKPADLAAVKADLAEARAELKTLREKNAEAPAKKPAAKKPAPKDPTETPDAPEENADEADTETAACGFW